LTIIKWRYIMNSMKINISKSKRGTNWDVKLTIPVKQKESNCYMEEGDLGDVDNICGMIDGYEFGFSRVINMSYAGKADQYSSIFLDCGMFMSKEDFEKMCKKAKIDIVQYCRVDDPEDGETVEGEIDLLVRDITSRDFMVKSNTRGRIKKIIKMAQAENTRKIFNKK